MSNSLFRKKSIEKIEADAAIGLSDAEHTGKYAAPHFGSARPDS
jgi:hypothetical protein